MPSEIELPSNHFCGQKVYAMGRLSGFSNGKSEILIYLEIDKRNSKLPIKLVIFEDFLTFSEYMNFTSQTSDSSEIKIPLTGESSVFTIFSPDAARLDANLEVTDVISKRAMHCHCTLHVVWKIGKSALRYSCSIVQ